MKTDRTTNCRLPEPGDAELLAATLSSADRREILGQGIDVLYAIQRSVTGAREAYAVEGERGLICLFGVSVTDDLVPEASPWMLGTEEVAERPRELIEYTRAALRVWRRDYGPLTNYIDVRHARAVRWLKHFGATFELIPAYGIYAKPYYKFTL